LKGILRSKFPTRERVKFENPWFHYTEKEFDLYSRNRKSLIVPEAIIKANLGED
jgi:hypothetical protein